jgi:cytochrome c peroxidase
MHLLLAAVLVIPLGLDLYMPVPEENRITAEKIELGRRLFHDRRLTVQCFTETTQSQHSPGTQPV